MRERGWLAVCGTHPLGVVRFYVEGIQNSYRSVYEADQIGFVFLVRCWPGVSGPKIQSHRGKFSTRDQCSHLGR